MSSHSEFPSLILKAKGRIHNVYLNIKAVSNHPLTICQYSRLPLRLINHRGCKGTIKYCGVDIGELYPYYMYKQCWCSLLVTATRGDPLCKDEKKIQSAWQVPPCRSDRPWLRIQPTWPEAGSRSERESLTYAGSSCDSLLEVTCIISSADVLLNSFSVSCRDTSRFLSFDNGSRRDDTRLIHFEWDSWLYFCRLYARVMIARYKN